MPEPDQAWETFVEVSLVPNRALDEAQRLAVERDYVMQAGRLTLPVRQAMLEYFLAHLRVHGTADRPEHLELAETPLPVPPPQ